MAKIVLISCVSKKLDHSAKARDMYISPLFKLSLKYAISSFSNISSGSQAVSEPINSTWVSQFFAGENYAKFIRDKLKHVEEPLKGLSIGNRLKFLKSKS